MEKLVVLGTGNAQAIHCYNTCFALCNIEESDETLLVDAGGGNGILVQLEKAGLNIKNIHHLIVTHEHTDHVLGVIWIIRNIATAIKKDKYSENLNIYCHKELAQKIRTMCLFTLQKKFTDLFDSRILFNFIDEESSKIQTILGCKTEFFSILSTKAVQYGFRIQLANKKSLTCLGDEPLNEKCTCFVKDSDWVLCEAFCMYADREIYKPYEKNHSTVKEACEMAQKNNVKNLVLWHTEDKNLANRKSLYSAEGKDFYSRNLFIPNDLEEISLN